MLSSNTLLLVAAAIAQYALPSSASALPAGAVTPSTGGFRNPIISVSKGGKAVCVSGTVNVNATTNRNTRFNFQLPTTQIQVTETFVEYVTSGTPFFDQIAGPDATVSGIWSIGATLCTPLGNAEPAGVQLLSHGVSFDRTYWDFALGYSYVDVAAENGYASLLYDRLGVGQSQKPDPIQVVQAALEVEIAQSLSEMLRGGSLSNHAFSKVVGVGHSYGSIITQAITANYPNSLDAAILTGFSVNASGVPAFLSGINLALANQDQPARFALLNNGYLVSSTIISNQLGQFRAPGFDPAILTLAEATKGTTTFGEMFTTFAVTAPALTYNKPVAVVDGAEDLPFCFGNCSYPINKAAAVQPALYPNLPATNFDSYLASTAGHGLNLHYSAAGAFDFIQTFLQQHGLGM